MKKLLLVTFLVLNFGFAFSQKYQPIDSSYVWNDHFVFKNMSSGCSSPCNYEQVNSSCQFHGYIINNGITWLKLYKSQVHSWVPCFPWCTTNGYQTSNFTDQFQGYLWDDTITKKVYITYTLSASFTPSTNNIIYDFLNKNVGDSLSWGGLYPYGPWSPIPMSNYYKFQIQNIDSILIGNKYHKRYTVQNNSLLPYPISVIEGILSFRGAFSSTFTDFERSSNLVCASKGNNGLAVTNPTNYVSTAAGCGTINTVPEIQKEIFSAHPNPASTELSIENIHYEQLIITDILGKTVLEQAENASKINVQSLPPGLYIIRMRSDGRNYTSKFIKE